jgi:polar amino acid transport system permease protein
MTEQAIAAGAGGARLPRAYVSDVPKGSVFLLIAAWVLLTEGALALLFLPLLVFTSTVDVPPGDIAAFAGVGIACLVGGGLLYSHWRWAWWLALAATLATIGWLASDKGLTSWSEVYAAGVFAVAVTVLLILGRRAAGQPEAMALASASIPFRVKLTLVWIAIFGVVATFLALVDLDTAWIRDNWRYIATGVVYTLFLALGAIVLAVILALLGALGRLSSNPVAYGVSGFYTSFFRGTPLIVQLFLIYNALPQIGVAMDRGSLINILTLTAFQAGVIGLGLNYGAYMTEIFRAGIQSVGHGQGEAADALGMNYMQRMKRVVLPQATRVIIPPTGNDFIAMMKDTALVGFLGVELARAELFKRANLTGNQDLRRLESLLVAAALYWALTAIFTFFQARLERRLSKGYVRGDQVAKGDRRSRLLSTGGSAPEALVDVPAGPGPAAVTDLGLAPAPGDVVEPEPGGPG